MTDTTKTLDSTTALVTRDVEALQAAQHGPMVPDDKLQLLRETICRGGSDTEIDYFVTICNRRRLDPFARQICFVKRWDSQARKEVMTDQATIDGLRLTAQRSGDYAGQGDVEWCGKDGVWVSVWLQDVPPVAARATVYRRGFSSPMRAVARFAAYAAKKKDGNLNPFWQKMPDLMIGKCAEALALRKAFPEDLSGLYIAEEMAQAENDRPQGANRNDVLMDIATANSLAELNGPVVKAITAAGLAKDAQVHQEFVRKRSQLYATLPQASKQGEAMVEDANQESLEEMEAGVRG